VTHLVGFLNHAVRRLGSLEDLAVVVRFHEAEG
jgi:hypothetical protein